MARIRTFISVITKDKTIAIRYRNVQILSRRTLEIKDNISPRIPFCGFPLYYLTKTDQKEGKGKGKKRFSFLGLEKCDLIRKGNFADLVIFDSSTIADLATYTKPKQYSKGIDYVIVNSKIVIGHGIQTGELPGKVLNGPGKR